MALEEGNNLVGALGSGEPVDSVDDDSIHKGGRGLAHLLLDVLEVLK